MKKFDPFKNLQLDEEEQQIERDLEAGLYQSVENQAAEIARIVAAAKNTPPRKTISLRVNYQDLLEFKANAAQERIPYQTLLSSLIYKYNTGQLIFRDRGEERYQAHQKADKKIKHRKDAYR